MKRAWVLRSIGAVLFCVPLGCASGSLGRAGIRAEMGYFRPEVSADFRVDGATLIGTDINLEATTDISTSEDSLYGAVAIGFGGFKLHLSGWQAEFGGSTDLTVPFDFGGESFQVSEKLFTDLEVTNGVATLEYSLSPVELVYLGLGLGIQVYDAELRMRQPAVSIDETFEDTIPLPLVSLSVEVNPVDFLSIFASGRGIYARSEWLGLDDTVQGESHSIDILGGVRAKWRFLVASAGYKWINLDLGLEEASADIQFEGFFATVGVEF